MFRSDQSTSQLAPRRYPLGLTAKVERMWFCPGLGGASQNRRKQSSTLLYSGYLQRRRHLRSEGWSAVFRARKDVDFFLSPLPPPQRLTSISCALRSCINGNLDFLEKTSKSTQGCLYLRRASVHTDSHCLGSLR